MLAALVAIALGHGRFERTEAASTPPLMTLAATPGAAPGVDFKVAVNVDSGTYGIGNANTEVVLGVGLAYVSKGCAEAVMTHSGGTPAVCFGVNETDTPDGTVVQSGQANALVPPFPPADGSPGNMGTIFTMPNVQCDGSVVGYVQITLTVFSDERPLGSAMNSSGAAPMPVPVKTIGTKNMDLTDDTIANPIPIDIADTITVGCKLADPGDSDLDGCSDVEESGPSATAGGQRDFENFWDFFDVDTENGASAGTRLEGGISLSNVFAVANRFGQAGDPGIDPLSDASGPGYHTRYDRGPQVGPNLWNRGPADGGIALSDIFAVAAQFAHSCT